MLQWVPRLHCVDYRMWTGWFGSELLVNVVSMDAAINNAHKYSVEKVTIEVSFDDNVRETDHQPDHW